MKKSRIKNVYVHRIPITEEQKNEIYDELAKYYAKAIMDTIKSMNLSPKQISDIISKI